MHDESRKDMIWWIAAGLLVLAMIAVAVIGAVKVTNWKRSTVWDLKVGEMSITPFDFENGMEGCEYYKLRFMLTNNSSKDIEAVSYRFDVYEKGNEGRSGVNVISPQWEENVKMHSSGCVPSGCTGVIELWVEVDRHRAEGNTLEVKLDPYSEGSMLLGTVEIPQ